MANIKVNLGEVIAWKYGHIADTADGKITVWRDPKTQQPSEIQLEIDRQEYLAMLIDKEKKQQEINKLPIVEDSMITVLKTFRYLQKNGLDLGPDMESFLKTLSEDESLGKE